MELKRDEIIKALEHCINDNTCEQCNYSPSTCFIQENALSLIKELTEENERLRNDNGKYEAENRAQFDKWLKLEEATKRHHSELFEEAKIAIKEDTVWEMKERLYQEANYSVCGYQCVSTEDVDQIAEEIIGGSYGKKD